MKKAQSQTSKQFSTRVGWLAVIVGLGIITLAAGFFVRDYWAFRNYEAAGTMRGLIASAVDGLHEPVLRDPQTGDYFVSEAKLTIMHRESLWRLLYYYESQENVVHITNKSTMSQAYAPITSARTVEEVLKHVPQYQACARGVSLRFTPLNGETLAWEKTLADGRHLYAYTDRACPYLVELANTLENIASY